MRLRNLILLVCLHAGNSFWSLGFAQTPEVSASKQREPVVEAADKVLAARSSEVQISDTVPNPFNWPVQPDSVDNTPVVSASNEPSVTGVELLARLAAQIPVTGTVNLGGNPILLLSQKRLKVGDTITISFEGQDYIISIVAIGSSSFTIKRGELIYTRPTRISSSSPRP